MPIVINEIVFKGEITGTPPRETRSSDRRAASRTTRKDDNALVEACVEEVMRILRRQGER